MYQVVCQDLSMLDETTSYAAYERFVGNYQRSLERHKGRETGKIVFGQGFSEYMGGERFTTRT